MTDIDLQPADCAHRPILLGLDTCGPTGSVALARLTGMDSVEVIAMTELEGRTYSATLLSAVADLLTGAALGLADVSCLVAVNGPGSFTGVRVGLSAVKGLAEGGGIPLVSVSRLEVLARKAGVLSAALDAHRHEIFLRVAEPGAAVRELLAGAADLTGIQSPSRIAACDDAAVALLAAAWPQTSIVRVPAPHAADALAVAAPAVAAKQFGDSITLDGHYLRRSDAEIFGAAAGSAR